MNKFSSLCTWEDNSCQEQRDIVDFYVRAEIDQTESFCIRYSRQSHGAIHHLQSTGWKSLQEDFYVR